jgi:hypothetical protein
LMSAGSGLSVGLVTDVINLPRSSVRDLSDGGDWPTS